MRRAAALGLYPDGAPGHGRAHLGGDVVAARPDDERDRLDPGGADRRQHVRQHRAAGDRVQDLGTRGAHPRPLAGGEDDGEAAA